MACWRCDDTGQCETRREPYTFTHNGRTYTKHYVYVAPCGVCDKGARIFAARVRKGLANDAKRTTDAA